VVVSKVTSLAHSHGVQQSLMMLAVPSILIPTILPVAAGAHILYEQQVRTKKH